MLIKYTNFELLTQLHKDRDMISRKAWIIGCSEHGCGREGGREGTAVVLADGADS